MAYKPKSPTHEEPAQSDDMDARRKEPYGPGQYRSGVDEPGEPTKKNPGHNNPSHNTPGHERGDKPDRPEPPGQAQPPSYPGIMGPKARKLTQDSKPPTEPASEKHPETIHPVKDGNRRSSN